MCDEILKKIPLEFDINKAKVSFYSIKIKPFQIPQKLFKIKATHPIQFQDSINSVFVQELLNYNRLTKVIKRSLIDIKNAVSGTVGITRSLEKVFNSMLMGKVPELWLEKSYLSLKSLGNYINDLCERLNFFKVRNEKNSKSLYFFYIIF